MVAKGSICAEVGDLEVECQHSGGKDGNELVQEIQELVFSLEQDVFGRYRT
jgi:hypothetical protein